MTAKQPLLVETYLMDGTLEGIRILDCESSVEAYYVPRLKLGDAKNIPELERPALYILLSNEVNTAYIGESENFYTRVSQHAKDDKKQWWTFAIAFVSRTNELEKSDVKYLESLCIERAKAGSAKIENGTVPPRNNLHRFKIHKIERVFEDIQLLTTFLGYDLFAGSVEQEEYWYATAKDGKVKAAFRGDTFVVLAGSAVNLSAAPSYVKGWPAEIKRREELIMKKTERSGEKLVISENIPFRSPNEAGQLILGRSINAWTTWRDSNGRTMDEVIRKSE